MDLKSKPSLNAASSLDGIHLVPEEAFVLSRVNGISSIAEIQKIVGFAEARILEIFVKLEKYKLITIEKATSKEQAVKSDKKITNSIQKRIRDKFDQMGKGDHYQVLEISKGSADSVIEQAYFQLSKEFHPDRFFKEPLGLFKKMLEEVFNGIQESYRILSDPDLKRQYIQQQRKRKVTGDTAISEEKPSRDAKHLAAVSSANEQYLMGKKEEEKGNLKAALNFYKMAIMFDEENRDYMAAYARIRELLKNPTNLL